MGPEIPSVSWASSLASESSLDSSRMAIGFLRSNQWIGGKFYRKTPWSSWENPWFPVKIFPKKPIHWSNILGFPVSMFPSSNSMRPAGTVRQTICVFFGPFINGDLKAIPNVHSSLEIVEICSIASSRACRTGDHRASETLPVDRKKGRKRSVPAEKSSKII